MVDSRSTDVGDVVEMVEDCQFVDVWLALVRVDDGWQVCRGEVTLHPAAAQPRTWRCTEDVFLERRIPGPVAARLLREELPEIEVTRAGVRAGLVPRACARTGHGGSWGGGRLR